jgi:hypothetical protein
MKTPTRGASSGVTTSAASSTANCDAAIVLDEDVHFLTSFFSMKRRDRIPDLAAIWSSRPRRQTW